MIISSWSGCLWKSCSLPGASVTSMTTKVVQPVLGSRRACPALPQSNCATATSSFITNLLIVLLLAQTGIDLNRRMFSVIAISVGRRSIEEAPKKPTMPSVRSIT